MRLTGNSFQFDETTCTFDSNQSGRLVWRTSEGDLLSVVGFNSPPDLAADLGDLNAVREYYRQSAYKSSMGLVEAEVVTLDEHSATWAVFKVPQDPTGMTYLGALTIPFRDGGLVVKLQCGESGITGTRETLVIAEKHKRGELKPGGNEALAGWFGDPYGAPTPADVKILWCLADDARYDKQLPDHPLSRLRRQRRTLLDTATLRPEIKAMAPFVYPPEPTAEKIRKPWWKR